MKYRYAIAVSLIFSTAVWASEPELLFRLHGSNTVGAALAPELIKSWLAGQGYDEIEDRPAGAGERVISARQSDGKYYKVEVHAHGSSTAFVDLGAGTADIGMASRPIKSDEVDALGRLGDLADAQHEFVIGLDGIAVIVNRDNNLQSLSVKTLRQIFSGQIRNWQALGGRPGPIHIYSRDDNSGTYDTFRHLVLDKEHKLVGDAKRYESNAKLSDDVSRDRQGIGFVGLPYIRDAKALLIADGGDAILPTEFSVATEDYALARRLFLYKPTHAPEAARQFANFAISSLGQLIVSKVGFISQNLREVQYPLSSQAPEEYRELTRDAHRLSVNFRFVAGSLELDSKGMRDIYRVVSYLKHESNNGRRVMLFGFADSQESLPMYSLVLSVARADRVADSLGKFDLGSYRTRGYGSDLAVALNDTDTGRFKNRRVEVWVK